MATALAEGKKKKGGNSTDFCFLGGKVVFVFQGEREEGASKLHQSHLAKKKKEGGGQTRMLSTKERGGGFFLQ